MKKKFFYLLICVIIIGCDKALDPACDNLTFISTRSNSKYSEIEGDASRQLLANQYCTKILKEIEMDGITPDFWGGAYTDEKGKLFILIKGDLQTGKTIISSIIPDDNIIEYIQCNYSLQELLDILNTINQKKHSLPEDIYNNIQAYYLEDAKNQVIVELIDTSHYNILQFKQQVVNHESIVFEKGAIDSQLDKRTKDYQKVSFRPKGLITHYFIKPGSYLSNNGDNIHDYNGSWGFSARDINDTTIIGMVTAAHVLTNDSAFLDGIYIGKTDAPYYTDDVDAAFVDFSINNPHWHFHPMNILTTESVQGEYILHTEEVDLSLETNLPIYGTIVNKRGWTTGLTTGTIESTCYYPSPRVHPGSIYGKTRASFYVDYGDSGGIVYTYFSKLNKRYTTGIINGRIINSMELITGGYFSKAPVILDVLGIERY